MAADEQDKWAKRLERFSRKLSGGIARRSSSGLVDFLGLASHQFAALQGREEVAPRTSGHLQ